MKQDTAKSQTIVAADEPIMVQGSQGDAAPFLGFARQLRALGQALEKFRFSTVELEFKDGTYLVKGRAILPEKLKFSFSRFVSELLRKPKFSYSAGQVDLRFSPEEIERFDVRGRIRRQDPGKMPDPYSISQILRGAGSYLDNREVTSWIGISLKGKWVTVSYQSTAGRLEQAQQDLEYFYDYWVKMYLRRSNREKISAPSDPTVLVTWHGIQRAGLVSKAS
jgi:hypothetical protein